jgi:formate hydrogenlyase transcriptional activator
MQEVPKRHEITNCPPQRLHEFSRRYSELLQTPAIAASQGVPVLLQELSKLLHGVFEFNVISYSLGDPGSDAMQEYILDRDGLCSTEHPVTVATDTSASGWVWSRQMPLVLPDLAVEERFLPSLKRYLAKGVRSLVLVPLTSPSQRLGAIGFGKIEREHFDDQTVHFLEQVAGLVALAISNLLTQQAVAGEEEQLRALTAVSIQLSERSTRAHRALRDERSRLETVLEINAALAATKLDMKQMFPAISKSLSRALPHDTALINLWNEEQQSYVVFAQGAVNASEFAPAGMVLPSEAAFTTRVLEQFPEGTTVRRADLELAAQQFEVVRSALQAGIVCWCTVPLRAPDRLVGVLYLGSRSENAFTEKDLELARKVAAALAVFIENALTHETLQREKEGLEKLLEISRTLTPNLDWKKLLTEIASCTRSIFNHEQAHLAVYDRASEAMRISVLDPGNANGSASVSLCTPAAHCPSGIAVLQGKVIEFGAEELEQMGSEFAKQLLGADISTLCCFPLVTRNGPIGTLCFSSKRENAFARLTIELMGQVAPQIAVALENSRAYADITSLKDWLLKEKKYLEEEIRDALDFEDIIGQSPALAQVLTQVRTVAPSDATVLILGETGTGKELVARAVHRLSHRANGNFVKVNCAAIPTGLLESELFGHEKGAFTGAISQKVGRLELADKGTLLLDEVGEIPLELQPKLLRALQDQEFERLGGTRTIKVNVRIIAATNRDLSDAVAKHQFRSDLYYRLHVFPLHLPPLRDRREDIPLLVRYFVQKFARRMNKHIDSIPSEAMDALERWQWPGNIRELENFLERSVILTGGTTLHIPVSELCSINGHNLLMGTTKATARGTLEDLEREYILQVLRQTGGVISGSGGAAAKLGMKRTTLQSKMQRLGITKEGEESPA